MNEKDLQELLQALEDITAEHTVSKEKAQKFLQEEGVIDTNGNLTDPYR